MSHRPPSRRTLDPVPGISTPSGELRSIGFAAYAEQAEPARSGRPPISAPRRTTRRDPQLQATVDALPTRYLMRDARGELLYVGKAQNLRSSIRDIKITQTDLRIHFSPDRRLAAATCLWDFRATIGDQLVLEPTLDLGARAAPRGLGDRSLAQVRWRAGLTARPNLPFVQGRSASRTASD